MIIRYSKLIFIFSAPSEKFFFLVEYNAGFKNRRNQSAQENVAFNDLSSQDGARDYLGHFTEKRRVPLSEGQEFMLIFPT